ncbi:MAG TPA: CobD/CbiB family cobalamin biosynthesis protein, partial [Mesorhizobium sp.]|nr:CobD/CbiB family cobalamin biosynthesis protein [Mesorhizobium sp.]
MSPLLAFLSLLAELGLGYPDRLFRAIGHPVTWLGRLIAFADRRLNRATDSDLQRRTAGVVALVLFVAVPAAASLMLETVLSGLPFGLLLSALAASPLLAQRSLGQHVQAVADALETGGLAEGRKAVSMIVGRDPERLDEAGVCRAAIESLAENFSDGIVAPAFWLGVGGLAGGAA